MTSRNLALQLWRAPDRRAWLHQYRDRKWPKLLRRLQQAGIAPREPDHAWPYRLENANGRMLLLDVTSLVDSCILQYGSWEVDQLGIMAAACDEALRQSTNPAFLDVGSYWALYSLMALDRGIRHVHAFEVDPRNLAQLHAQLFLNNAQTQVVVHGVAVSDREGLLPFRRSETIEGGNRGGTGVMLSASSETVDVPCTTLDRLFDWSNRCLVIKLDVEGHEPQALTGMAELIASNRVFIQVEMFREMAVAIMAEARNVGLRHVHYHAVDHYFTNMEPDEMAWLSSHLAKAGQSPRPWSAEVELIDRQGTAYPVDLSEFAQ